MIMKIARVILTLGAMLLGAFARDVYLDELTLAFGISVALGAGLIALIWSAE